MEIPETDRGDSLAFEARFEATTDQSPIEFRKPPNQAHFALQQRHGEQPEEGRLVQSLLSPIAQFAIGRSKLLRGLSCDQTDDYIGPVAMIKLG